MSKIKSTWNKGEDLLFQHLNIHSGRIHHHLSNIARSRYEWDNLPLGLESRHIESALFHNGQAFLFNDDKYGLMCLPASSVGNFNPYGDPTQIKVQGIGYSKTLNLDEGVRIMDNVELVPPLLMINYYSSLIAKIETTINKNLKQQRYPYIIPTTSESERTMKKMYAKLMSDDVDDEALFVDKRLDINGDSLIKVLKTDAPYILDKLQDFKTQTMSEVLTYLGINNGNTEKRERLIVDEVNSNNAYILLNLELPYKLRQKACEEINKKFGLNITVKKVIEDVNDYIQDGFNVTNQRGDDNGEI